MKKQINKIQLYLYNFSNLVSTHPKPWQFLALLCLPNVGGINTKIKNTKLFRVKMSFKNENVYFDCVSNISNLNIELIMRF